MRYLVLFLLTLLVASMTCIGASLGLVSEGSLALGLPSSAVQLDASLAVVYESESVSGSFSVDLGDAGLQVATLNAAVSGEIGSVSCRLTAEMAFDALDVAASEKSLAFLAEFDTLRVEAGLLRQGAGVGATLDLTAGEDQFLRSLAVGMNVDAYGYVQSQSCSLAFTYAEACFGLSCGCADVEARVTCLGTGFSELELRVADAGELPFGIQLGFGVRYRVDDKTTFLAPSTSSENPGCVELYTGLVWDEASSTLGGLALYGIGLACEVDGVRIRGLWELDPTAIALVKEPYWALLGFVWDVAGCCGEPGEGSVAFFFGDEGLFDIGEAEFALEWPAAPGLELSIGLSLEPSGVTSITFGWRAEI